MTLKDKNDVKGASGRYWYRCSRVEFVGDAVKWELNPQSRYSFFDAYVKKPHLQFIEAKDDDALRNFVRAWGPLYFSIPWESKWGNSHPIGNYRNERDKLIAYVQLLASVEERQKQRYALTQWVEVVHKDGNDNVALSGVRQALHIPGDLLLGFDQSFRAWLERATSQQIESAILAVVPQLSVLSVAPLRFFVDRVGRRNVVRAELGLDSLSEALHWMVWQDYFQKRPYRFCEECGSVFGIRGGYKRKYCPGPCAHRKAARESYRRKRDERKEERANVTQKTR